MRKIDKNWIHKKYFSWCLLWQVEVDKQVFRGTGPNKKVAKASAALAALNSLFSGSKSTTNKKKRPNPPVRTNTHVRELCSPCRMKGSRVYPEMVCLCLCSRNDPWHPCWPSQPSQPDLLESPWSPERRTSAPRLRTATSLQVSRMEIYLNSSQVHLKRSGANWFLWKLWLNVEETKDQKRYDFIVLRWRL